jgi:lipoic acid synthetase
MPAWLRSEPLSAGPANATRKLLDSLGLETICRQARCPNLGQCYAEGTATFLVMGTVCTRSCRFCGVTTGTPSPPDHDEPRRVAHGVRRLGLDHAVVTSVTRDDLLDGGAAQFRQTVEAIKQAVPQCTVEALVPDFGGARDSLADVLGAGPHVLGHDLETVERLHAEIRPGADYARSLRLLARARILSPGIVTKSALILGQGEATREVERTLADLASVGCQIVCVGQYLRPSRCSPPVSRYVAPEEFDQLKQQARRLGIPVVLAGPLVRSSYRAREAYQIMQRGAGNTFIPRGM